MQTDDDCTDMKSDMKKIEDSSIDTPRPRYEMTMEPSLDDDSSKLAEAAAVPLPGDAEDSDEQEIKENKSADLSESTSMDRFLNYDILL